MEFSSAMGGDDLFEGMVLFSPSDLAPIPGDDAAQPPQPPAAAPSPPQRDPSSPLDEDLFSDLTLLSPAAWDGAGPSIDGDPSPASPNPAPAAQPLSRQISRKKKRAVRIGYAREASSSSAIPADDAAGGPLLHPKDLHEEEPLDPPRVEANVDIQPDPPQPPPLDAPLTLQEEEEVKEDDGSEIARPIDEEGDSNGDGSSSLSIEEELERVRRQISEKLHEVRNDAALVSADRKELGRRRRKAAENLRLASEEYKELEKEMEGACEAEDFERAERVSERLAASEKEKELLLAALRDAEAVCDLVDMKMQEILEQQIAVEEESAALLEQFSESAVNHADFITKDAKDILVKKTEEWQTSIEILEIRRIEVDIESHLVREARSQLDHSIEHLVEDDRKEREALMGVKDKLAKDLEELHAMVRAKEAEIAENEARIQEVDGRISNAAADFHGSQTLMDRKYDELKLSISEIELQNDGLVMEKAGFDESFALAEERQSKLAELARTSSEEARNCRDLVCLRKRLASFISKTREDKVMLAAAESRTSLEIQVLRQHITSLRSSLQDFSFTRSSIQQDIVSIEQRISFIEKRGPELEAEKKVAAAARNFREAGRIAAEAKTLNLEMEDLTSRKEKALSDLEKLEQEIKNTVDKIHESEGLIVSKEKEVAVAAYKRFQLIAAATRVENSAAIELGDDKESGILLQEAEDAESKAKDLQQTYGIVVPEEEQGVPPAESFMVLVADIGKKDLAKTSPS